MPSYYPDPQEVSAPVPQLYDAHVDIVIDGALLAARGDVFGDDVRRMIDDALGESGRRFAYSAHVGDIPFDGSYPAEYDDPEPIHEWQPSSLALDIVMGRR